MNTKEAGINDEVGKEKLVYLLSPVRKVTEDQAKIIADYAESLKVPGIRVFNPVNDAPQQDATGYNIVMAELNFLHEASKNGGRVDILWNMGGKPSEGSRVDVGIAIALGIEINLVTEFNKNEPAGPQACYRLLKGGVIEKEMLCTLMEILEEGQAVIDWDIDMKGAVQEWQRIFLGLALGKKIKDPNFKIYLGDVYGIDPPETKSYVKVIKEIEARAS